MNRVRKITNTVTRSSNRSPVICLVADPNDYWITSVLKPFPDEINLVIGNDIDDLKRNPQFYKAEAMIWLWSSNMKTFTWAFEKLCGQIRWIHSYPGGLDKMSEFISARLVNHPEVLLTTGRGACSSDVAEYVFCAALHFNKKIPRIMENRKNKHWDQFIINTLKGKTIGLVGFGDIGVEVARRAKIGFGMRVLALRRDPSKGDANGLAEQVFGFKDRLELFRRSDLVVCSLPKTDDTKNFCGEEEFNAMRPSATFISVGRGSAVCEDSLCNALRSGSIANAALDVFQNEPLQRDSSLWEIDNLLITSHNVAITSPEFSQMYEVWRKNYMAYCESRPLLTIVDMIQRY